MSSSDNYRLGPLPWSDEVLVAAAWENPLKAQEWVDEHPGRTFVAGLESLNAVLRIFERSTEKFGKLLAHFHEEAHSGDLFRRNRRSDLEAYEDQFQELLYVFVSSAMTLVDQTRALSQKVILPEYDVRVSEIFAKNPRHRFIQELRVDVIHITLHRPEWQLAAGRNEELSSSLMLWKKQLTRLSKYKVEARQFVDDHPNGIDLGALVVDYSREVCTFHKWLRRAIEIEVGGQINDYLRYLKRVKAVSSHSFWNFIFQQVIIASKRDPYKYLDQYLTDEELNEVNILPFRSRQQIDRIIKLVDEYEACDDKLRQTIYKAFGALE
ncbi:hypothetical protein HA399_17390 (plasmid) [Cobetia sp. UIB-001]|uniref:hypothetical protein n=1 Tax=Cobetia sp. UIB-001 TaxID=2717697 RepID=UPI00385003A4